MYEIQFNLSEKQTFKMKHSRFVEVNNGDKSIYIHKTTAVWLLEETEYLSSDRRIRVRSKQPFSTNSNLANKQLPSVIHLVVRSSISVGDMCVFRTVNKEWRIGRVLQFSHYLEKKISAKQYRNLTADVSNTKIGILCSWYSVEKEVPVKFTLSQKNIPHTYISIKMYLCTLPNAG